MSADISSIIAQVRERVQNPSMDMSLNEIDRLRDLAGGGFLFFGQHDADAVLEYLTALLDRIEELEAEAETARGFEMTWKNHRDELLAKLAEARADARLYALGDHLRKTKGSSWQGRVVGFYSTLLTPVGYCIESEREPGSVQIYPESALERVPESARAALDQDKGGGNDGES